MMDSTPASVELQDLGVYTPATIELQDLGLYTPASIELQDLGLYDGQYASIYRATRSRSL